ncbi:MAG: 4'-phosphopantetheinyl transferase superfamily protein [Methanosarcina sp.]|jgi:4'-phosphopantetheinyl transferase|nr:4'-phosphopantetheinyl transferase superfamily protein [Methanosarcina sp.]MDD3317186.1 4'-phosphopantetheinyl transferase superfamily protein [Methanosarcina sp.]MDD4306222.1 4'-phosphopantetheinyl transferase superfamily protein [Methanosarcina sp.]MDD4620829.1 4'-phosphopantetheinyl transferase superfamily protein [Methanosarcina sp.]
MKIFALNDLESMDDLVFKKLLTNISNEKQARIKKFARPDDAKRTLLADILVRSVVASELKVSNKTIEFNANKYGKPFLKGNFGLHFNVSHSENWVVCVVDDKPVGIDIEKIKPVELEIAARFFSDDEYKMLMAKSPKDRQDFFFDLWTLKESYIKAVGEGLSLQLKSFTVSFLEKGEIAAKSGNKLTNWTLKQYYLDPKYKMAVCATHKAFPDNVVIKKLEDICSELNE